MRVVLYLWILLWFVSNFTSNNTKTEMTEQKDKLNQPYLTYKQGVMDCWNYLYYEIGMKDLADQMLDYVCDQQEEFGTDD
jgi:hypothetical protein